MLGAPTIGSATLARFFTLHVFVIPGIRLSGVGVHIWMVLLHVVSEWPMPGRLGRKATYEREYHELTLRTGIPFVPDAAWKDAVFARGDHLGGDGDGILLRAIRSWWST